MISDTLKAQFVTASVHFIVFLWCTWNAIHSSYDALWESVWFILVFPDFPASALLFISLNVIPNNVQFALDGFFENIFSTFPYNSFYFWFIVFIYGILGTVWWFYVPRIVMWIAKRLRIVQG